MSTYFRTLFLDYHNSAIPLASCSSLLSVVTPSKDIFFSDDFAPSRSVTQELAGDRWVTALLLYIAKDYEINDHATISLLDSKDYFVAEALLTRQAPPRALQRNHYKYNLHFIVQSSSTTDGVPNW